MTTADLADSAANLLDLLAAEIEALDGIDLNAGTEVVRRSRERAADALGRLFERCFTTPSEKSEELCVPEWSVAYVEAGRVRLNQDGGAETLRTWAHEWRVFAGTACTLCHLPRLPLISGRCAECRSEAGKE